MRNKDQRPGDYGTMKSQPRPSHADYTYHAKYGTHSSSGGGRSSARETIGRVAAGAVAEKWLYDRFGIEIVAWVLKPSCLLLHNFSLFVSFLSFPFFPFRSIPLSASIAIVRGIPSFSSCYPPSPALYLPLRAALHCIYAVHIFSSINPPPPNTQQQQQQQQRTQKQHKRCLR